MSRPELPPGWVWHSDLYAAHIGAAVGVSRDGDEWLGRNGGFPTLTDAIASHAERVAAWEAEVRRVVAATPAPARDPRVDPRPGDVLRVVWKNGGVDVYVVDSIREDEVTVTRAGDPPSGLLDILLTEWRDWSDFVSVDVLWPR